MNKLKEDVAVSRGLLWILGGLSPLSVMVAVIVFSINLGSYKENIEGRIFKTSDERNEIINKARNEDRHFQYRAMAKDFVPRNEIEYKLEDMKDDLIDIKKALNIKQ